MKTILMVQHTESEHHINGHIGAWQDWYVGVECTSSYRFTDEKESLPGMQIVFYTRIAAKPPR